MVLGGFETAGEEGEVLSFLVHLDPLTVVFDLRVHSVGAAGHGLLHGATRLGQHREDGSTQLDAHLDCPARNITRTTPGQVGRKEDNGYLSMISLRSRQLWKDS